MGYIVGTLVSRMKPLTSRLTNVAFKFFLFSAASSIPLLPTTLLATEPAKAVIELKYANGSGRYVVNGSKCPAGKGMSCIQSLLSNDSYFDTVVLIDARFPLSRVLNEYRMLTKISDRFRPIRTFIYYGDDTRVYQITLNLEPAADVSRAQ
jgi:hypothetical protein